MESIANTLVEQRRHGKFSGSGYILGMPGSGVSPAAKEQIASILQESDDRVIVVDTKGQYGPLAKCFGGKVIRVGRPANPKDQVYINPFDINLRDGDFLSPEALKVDFITAWLETSFGGASGFTAGEKSVLTWFIGRIVTEDARWGIPWVWIVFGIGFAVTWISIIVSML